MPTLRYQSQQSKWTLPQSPQLWLRWPYADQHHWQAEVKVEVTKPLPESGEAKAPHLTLPRYIARIKVRHDF